MKPLLLCVVMIILNLVSKVQSQDIVEIPFNTVTSQLLKPEGLARLGFSGVTCKPNPEIIISVEGKFGLFTVGDSINFNGFKGKLVSFNGCSSDTLKITIEFNRYVQLGPPDTMTFDLLQDGNAHPF